MRIAVIGGGVAGLAAAHRVVERAPDVEVVVIEQARSLGGKLRTGRLAGLVSETGAESFLARAPGGGPSAAVLLARSVGLGAALVHPAGVPAAVVVDGQLRDLPAGTMMGVPAAPSELPDWVRAEQGLDTDSGAPLLRAGEDIAVGALLRARLGDRLVDTLVDPLLGGVYAGRADHLSLRATMPALAAAAEVEHTLTGAARTALGGRTGGGPMFATVDGGVSRLVDAIASRLAEAKVEIRLGLPARAITYGQGWDILVGPTREPETVTADAVIVAVPATPAGKLLSTVDDVATVPLRYASVALVSLALPVDVLPVRSGLLVPATEGYAVKAATFFARKWPHHTGGQLGLVRASLGRAGEEDVLQRTDPDLIEVVRDELAALLGIEALPPHQEAAVYRWGGALPQYPPGHLDRVGALRARLAERFPGLAVAGAAYDGVGIPACVTSGRAAADLVLESLEQ